jgi:gliding motility-associated-like protein
LEQLVILNYPVHGTLIINKQDSTIIYVPEDYYVGLDSFQYSMGTKWSQTTDDAWVRINVVERLPIIPKAFSPNGDGINDFLIIKHIELYRYNKITIFNRWGNVVYVKENYTNDEPWDGIPNKGIRVGSGIIPTGTYLYLLDLGDLKDEERNTKYRVWKGNIYVASHN